MSVVSRLVRETFTISRFTLIGLLATATHAGVGSGAVLAGTPPFIANAMGFVIAWIVSFYGHFLFTFGQPNDIRVARTRFIVISLSLFAVSQLTVTLLQAGDWVSNWMEPVIGAFIVPPVSYLLYRLYVFKPDRAVEASASVSGDRIALSLPGAQAGWAMMPRFMWIHRLLAPFALFALFFNLSILDPTEVGWLTLGDMGQHFIGWLAFLHDGWHWPIGFSELVAYPEGAPLTATDSNPLFAIPLKLLSPILPDHFQYVGWWYLLCIFLSYNIAYDLLMYLSRRPLAAFFATIIVIAQAFFFQRYGHETLMAHWLILAAFSVFIRPHSDGRASAKHAGIIALAITIHPYFLPMTYSVAGIDILRRAYRGLRKGAGRVATLLFLLRGFAIITVPALLIGWTIGIFALEPQPQPIGYYSMDPFAWFNGRDYSAVLSGWKTHDGQYEGAQYLGIGGLICLIVAIVLWLTGLAKPPEALRRALPWLLPAMVVLFVLAISPTIRAFDIKISSVNVSDWPVVGFVYSAFRSSGRFGWPIGYLMVLTSVALWLTIRSRAVAPLLAVLAVAQLADISIVADRTRGMSAPRELQFQYLDNLDAWREMLDASQRVYASAKLDRPILMELGLLAFPRQKSINRFYFAQDLKTPEQKAAENREHDQVLLGDISDDVLYVLDPAVIGYMLRTNSEALKLIQVLDGQRIIPPGSMRNALDRTMPLHPGPGGESLQQLVADCIVDCAVIISVRDDGYNALPREFVDLVDSRGGTMSAMGFRYSYAAIIVDGRVVEEAVSERGDVAVAATVFGHDVKVGSGGGNGSNETFINIDGFEFSPNVRGINIVRLQPEGVSAVNGFDTHADVDRALIP